MRAARVFAGGLASPFPGVAALGAAASAAWPLRPLCLLTVSVAFCAVRRDRMHLRDQRRSSAGAVREQCGSSAGAVLFVPSEFIPGGTEVLTGPGDSPHCQ